MTTEPRGRGSYGGLHSRRTTRTPGPIGRALRRHSVAWAALVLLGIAALLPGASASSTFADTWTAQTEYLASTFGAGALTSPSSFTVTPSGTSMLLSWANGSNGNANDVAVSAGLSSSACSASTTVSPLRTLTSTATTMTDASSAIPIDTTGEWLCYQLLTGWGFATTGLATAISQGGSVSSLKLSSVPAAIASGDTITLTNASNQSESFTTTAAAATSASAESVAVSTVASATYGFPTSGSTAYDATSWTSWTSPTSAAASYASNQVGLVAQSVKLTNGATADQLDKGDTIQLVFNQEPSLTPLTTYTIACGIGNSGTVKNEIVLGDETVGSGGSCAGTDTAAFGVLKSSANLTNTIKYSGLSEAWNAATRTLTITFPTSSNGTTFTKFSGSPTWTFVPASTLQTSATPAVAACVVTTTCTPAESTTQF